MRLHSQENTPNFVDNKQPVSRRQLWARRSLHYVRDIDATVDKYAPTALFINCLCQSPEANLDT